VVQGVKLASDSPNPLSDTGVTRRFSAGGQQAVAVLWCSARRHSRRGAHSVCLCWSACQAPTPLPQGCTCNRSPGKPSPNHHPHPHPAKTTPSTPTPPANENTKFMEDALKAQSVQFDLVKWDEKASPRPSLKTMLYKGGAPAYKGVVLIPNLEGTGAMNKAEVRTVVGVAWCCCCCVFEPLSVGGWCCGWGGCDAGSSCSWQPTTGTNKQMYTARNMLTPTATTNNTPDAPQTKQVTELWDYQKATGARSSRWNVWPAAIGFEADKASCGSGGVDAKLTAAAPAAPAGVPGGTQGAVLDMSGIYRCGLVRGGLEVCGRRLSLLLIGRGFGAAGWLKWSVVGWRGHA